MKTNIIGTILIVLFSIQSVSAQVLENELADLINKQDYFALRDRYTTAKDSVQAEVVKLLSEAFLASAFNKLEDSNKLLGELLNNHQASLGMNGITSLIVAMSDNMKRQGNYRQSASVLQSFLDQTAAFNGLDSLTRENLSVLSSWGALGDGMKPEIIRPQKDCKISYFRGSEKMKDLAYVNVELNGNIVDFVFDTGADAYDTNFVSEGFARRNGIRILDDSVVISGTANKIVRLGLADSMKIGDIVYKNVTFTVAPGDNVLPVDTLFLDAVLGSVFMKAMGEIQIYPKEKKIVFPHVESEMPFKESNMIFIGGQPYIEGYSENERLLLHFDTGGGVSLSSKYYQKHKEEIENEGRLYSEGGIGGFGAMKKMNQYILPSFSLRVGEYIREVKDVHVLTDEGFPFVVADGSVGNDFVNLFDKVTINYNKMFINFE